MLPTQGRCALLIINIWGFGFYFLADDCSDERWQRGPRARTTGDGEKLKTEDSRVTAIGALDVHSRAMTLPFLGILYLAVPCDERYKQDHPQLVECGMCNY